MCFEGLCADWRVSCDESLIFHAMWTDSGMWRLSRMLFGAAFEVNVEISSANLAPSDFSVVLGVECAVVGFWSNF